MATRQIVTFGNFTYGTGPGTGYTDLLFAELVNASVDSTPAIWSATGVFRNLKFRVSAAPGSGKSVTFTVRKGTPGSGSLNLADTAMVVTISDTETEGVYSGELAVTDGQVLSLKTVLSGTATAATVWYSFEFESDTTGQSAYGAFSGGVVDTTQYTGAFSMREWNSTRINVQSVCPAAGAITKLNVLQQFGGGPWTGSYTFHIYKNGVKQDGSGGTVDTGVTHTTAHDFTVQSKTFSLSLSPGDLVAVGCTISSPSAVPNFYAGVQFASTTAGHSILCGGTAALGTGASTVFFDPSSRLAGSIGSDLNLDGAITPYTLKNLCVAATVAPGSGDAWELSLRRNGSSPAGTPTVTLSEAETADQDLVNSLAITSSDTFSLRMVTTGSPSASTGNWGMVIETEADDDGPGPGPGNTVGTDGLIEMCFHRGTSFRTWIKYRGLGDELVARRFWWLGDVQTLKAFDDINELPQQGATGTYEELPTKVYGLIPEYGLATWFDGTTQRISTLTGLENTGGQFTLIALVRPDAAGLGSAQCIYQTGAVGSAYLGINASDHPVFGVNAGTVIASSLTVEADKNYLVVGTYDGSDGTIFAAECVIDATLHENGPTALTFTTDHFIGTIGSNENTEYFTGAIQHVAELEDVLDLEDFEGLHSTTYWTDVTEDVEGLLTSDIGIHDDSPLARIAATGQLRLTMDNSALNSAGLEGYYSPDHANVREGFQRGIPIRFSLFDQGSPTERVVQFIGTIRSIRPTPGIYLERRSIILATDWMDEAARSTLRALEVQTDVTADEVVGLIVNSMRNRPHAIDFDTGSDTYTVALHNTTDEGTPAHTELLKVAQTELGLIYVRGDGTLVFESRHTRSSVTDAEYTFTDFLTVDQDDAADQAKNLIKVTAHPSRVGDDPAQVLYSNDSTSSPADPAIQLDNGINMEIFLPFRDLDGQETVRIGATEIIDPVATTDYLINTAEDGSGANVTGHALITLSFVLGGNGVYLRVNNQYGQRVWITFLQIRGRAVYDFEPVTAIAQNSNNIDEIGEQELALDMPYQSQPGIAQGAADFLLNSLRERQTRLKSVTFWGDYTSTHRQALIHGTMTTRLHASELMSGISGEYFVNAKRIEWKPSGDQGLGDIDVTFHVAGVNEVGAFWVLDESALDETTRLAYL